MKVVSIMIYLYFNFLLQSKSEEDNIICAVRKKSLIKNNGSLCQVLV